MELDAIGARRRRRHPLPARPGLPARWREARARRRFHVACADADGNVELFMQAGFARYGEELICFRPPRPPLPGAADRGARRPRSGIRPAGPTDARRPVPPLRGRDARSRSSAWSAPDRRLGAPGRGCADAALQPDADPALRRRRGVRPGGARRRAGSDGRSTASSRSAWPRRTSRTTSGSSPGPGPTPGRSSRSAWASSPPATERRDHGRDHGVIAPVRTYESPARPAPGGGGLRHDRDRHAADEGDARPRRRAGPGAGRPLREVARGPTRTRTAR